MRLTGLVVAALLLAGCGSGAGTAIIADAGGEQGGALDLWEAGGPGEVGLAETVDALELFDGLLPVELIDLVSGPEPGETGYPCETGADCNEGFCIQTGDGMQCTLVCEEECPFGWHCVQHTPSLPDQIFICVPTMLELCRPCMTNADCMANGADAGQTCVEYGGGESYCGAKCDSEEVCPLGFTCMEVEDVTGAAVSQCVLEEGECACSNLATDAGASTGCSVDNVWGVCHGTRLCLADELTECDAAVPAQEVCNDVDDNCDGKADEDLSGGDCLDTNEYGTCAGMQVCEGGVLTCQGDKAAPEICDGLDNDCDTEVDEGFPDTDGDGDADCLETDVDGDGVLNDKDNCEQVFNPGQGDADLDTVGDACDPDDDNDQVADEDDCAPKDNQAYPGAEEVCDGKDNDCDLVADDGFPDSDGDGWKDCLDDDDDNDGSPDDVDCSPFDPDVHVGAGEECNGVDDDCDGEVDEGFDDTDLDGLKDCVDPDDDNDGVVDAADNCQFVSNVQQEDGDGDGVGDVCDGDADGDAIPDSADNCVGVKNTLQNDLDGDGSGDECDDDMDGDGVDNGADNCPLVFNAGQFDTDGDGVGDKCEDDKDGDGVPDELDCAPLNPAISPEKEEVCDGVDNDCDYVVDEAFPDLDSDGLKDCIDGDDDGDGDPDDGDCAPLDPTVNHAALETCDGADQDCDSEIDEGLGMLACGKGVCFHTLPACAEGVVQVCDPMEGAAAESCDGLDNDCDGIVDEDLGWLLCGLGQCQHLVYGCGAGQPAECDAYEGAQPEGCDGVDNDCDGMVDDDLGTTTCGLGVCEHTLANCLGGVPQVCDPLQGAMPELCDGGDNDCDGEVDEELGSTTCGLGECEHAVVNCAGGVPQMCNPIEGLSPEVCDGLDNDCDGEVDDDLGTTTCGLGPCEHTVDNCQDGEASVCDPFEGAVEEICFNDVDDDCNPETSDTCSAASCLEHLQNAPGAESGVFLLDPDGLGPQAAFEARCDMASGGGGWTLIASEVNGDGRHWDTLEAFAGQTSFGVLDQAETADYKSPGHHLVGATDLMVSTSEYSLAYNGLLGGVSFSAYMAANWPGGCMTEWWRQKPDWWAGITEAQAELFNFVLRGHDINDTCWPGNAEAAAVTFMHGGSAWNNGLGNSPNPGQWGSHDHSFLQKSRLNAEGCSGGYPCNSFGKMLPWASECYDASCKATFVLVWVR